ncbi:MAG TPA: tetratricopeptide repeat protein [Gallionellaceae bacterium]
MAALDMHEQEQVDALKAWWKENGTRIIMVVVLIAAVVAAMFGWKYWQGKQRAEAFALFQEVAKQTESNDPKRVDDAAAIVVSKYGQTIYAVRAQLLAAQFNIDAKNTASAASQLQWVIEHASEHSMQDIARLQLASLRLDEKKFDEALKLLDAEHPDSFDSLYLGLKGDVFSAQGKKDEARAAYKQALEKATSRGNYSATLQIKLDALGVAPEAIASGANAAGGNTQAANTPGAAK